MSDRRVDARVRFPLHASSHELAFLPTVHLLPFSKYTQLRPPVFFTVENVSVVFFGSSVDESEAGEA